ncbi:MAG: polysaccharide biosynthesis tyrosine autokinase [Phycisphaeraceae bacterium]|nr:polysaccharide biosynthesis tyrosine autokinase [Phycisphaeraceae bacterium]
MTTATPPRPSVASPSRPVPAGPGGSPGVASVDPIKLLKQHATLLTVCVIVGGMIGLAFHFTMMATWPVYQSQVIYECALPIQDMSKVDAAVVYSQDEIDRFMGTQAALMTSELVLQAAAKDPEVMDTKWAKGFVNSQGAYQWRDAAIQLENRLSARVRPMTMLVQLTCTWKNAAETATLVNAVNRAYLEDFQRSTRSQTSDRRDALGRRLQDLRETIQSLASQRERIITETGLDADGQQIGGQHIELQQLSSKRTEDAAKAATLLSLLEEYRQRVGNMGEVQFPDRVRDEAMNDALVKNMDSELADLRSREQSFQKQGLGDNHPDVKAIRTLIASKANQRDRAFEDTLLRLFNGLMDSTRSSYEATISSVRDLDQKIAESNKKREQLLQAKLRLEVIKDQIERYTANVNDAENAIKQLDVIGNLKEGNRVRVIRSGQTPTKVTFPKLYISVPGGAILLPLLVGGALFLREVFDQRVRGPADLSLIPRLKLLGMIPDAAEDPARPANVALAFRDSPQSVVTESIRQLRAPLSKKLEQAGHKSMLVMAGMPGSGATTTACNLAIANAATDIRVLVIDANFRRPGVHKVFGLPEGPGLGDVLANQAQLATATQSTNVPNLSVLAAGTSANRALPERLATDTMTRLLREAADSYDLVLVDAPPAIVSGDGLVLANRCDAVCLVVRALAEKRGLVARLQAQLLDCRGEFLGVIVNAVRSSAGGYFKRNIKATHEYQNAKA